MASPITRFLRNRLIDRRYRSRDKTPSKWRRRLIWTSRICLIIFALDVFYLMSIWPNWDEFGMGKMQKSNFIKAYEERRRENRKLPRLQWQPVRYSHIPEHMRRAVIVAEDARFYYHNGFDLIAFKEAMDANLDKMSFRYGGSTISQQTIKNIYFSSSRNPLRKWHELVFTVAMELQVDKNRILATYLNIAEFGRGIYGVEAASRYYWQKSASDLTGREAAELAATLPSPIKHNPETRTKRFLNRVEKIYHWMQMQNE